MDKQTARRQGFAGLIAIAAALAAPAAWADDYCCICKGKTTGKTISAGDDLTAGAQCSITCRRPTVPRPGKCETAPAPTPAPAPPAAAGTVLLFASDDCSGNATKLTASSPKVAGMRSFMVESGAPASVWQKADYAGTRTMPVGAGICISPGWEIGSVRFEGK
jgi:hypothetical protein